MVSHLNSRFTKIVVYAYSLKHRIKEITDKPDEIN